MGTITTKCEIEICGSINRSPPKLSIVKDGFCRKLPSLSQHLKCTKLFQSKKNSRSVFYQISSPQRAQNKSHSSSLERVSKRQNLSLPNSFLSIQEIKKSKNKTKTKRQIAPPITFWFSQTTGQPQPFSLSLSLKISKPSARRERNTENR